jgi:rod shape-determining protein MreD
VIVTPKILARLVAIVFAAVLLQLAFFSQVTLFNASPDVLPAVVVSLGLLGGTMAGAVSGFSVGFLLACLLLAPLGGYSLVLLATGYLAGLVRERSDLRGPLLPPLLCMGLTLFAELGFGAIELMLGIDATVSAQIIRDILLQTIFAFFIGWAVYLTLRRVLRPALVEDRVVRRSSQPTVLGA